MCSRATLLGGSRRRRGAVAPLVAVMLPVLLGFAALSIDVGYMYVVQTQLQNAADAAALAGSSTYFEDVALSQDQSEMTYLATGRAQAFSLMNSTMTRETVLDPADIRVGRHDFDNASGALLADGRWNAVEVMVRATPGSANGSVRLFFAGLFGISETGLVASARAVVDDRFGGYRATGTSDLVPFTVHEDVYRDMAQNGPDEFSYDGVYVKDFGDGIREVKLFPWKEHGGGNGNGNGNGNGDGNGNDGAGNFGTLNVGLGSQGTSFLEEQILNGITAEQLEAEFGTSLLLFTDEDGTPLTYESTGNPGLSTGMKDAVAARLGDVVGFFIHSGVAGTGANATFTITGIRFGRIVEVQLVGNPDGRALTIQPAAYTSGNVIVVESAPSTGGLIGRPVLVQ